jgi:hypothetical protein
MSITRFAAGDDVHVVLHHHDRVARIQPRPCNCATSFSTSHGCRLVVKLP